MSELTLKEKVRRMFVRGTKPVSGRAGRSASACPQGHPMDPSWVSCPRCESERRANARTSEAPDAWGRAADDFDNRRRPMQDRDVTVVPDGTRPGNDREAFTSGEGHGMRRFARLKITGVLVTFTWEPQGEIFVLFEGRNVIGKGRLDNEGGRPCDVLLTADATLSSEHAVILCRAGRYELFDNRSTNGTYADDRFVESSGVLLRDGARIKTGETVWLFRKLEPDHDEPLAPPPPLRREETQAGQAPRRPGDSRWNEAHRPSGDDSRFGKARS
jgi:pSer/pThr/pTyr-binding forkhead associated (FHA) protein